MQPAPVTIVGAGLAGSLLGLLLARRGFTPLVYERRPDMRREAISAGRSINLALAARGINALERAGVLPIVQPLLIPMRGRMIHDIDGRTSLQPYGKDASEAIYSVSRGDLNKLLMTELERRASIAIRFRQNCRGVDFFRNRLKMFDETQGILHDVPGEPVFATDGASSAVRQAMAADGLVTVSEDVLSHQYKELHIPPDADGRSQMEPNALHIWPRGGYMLIALPNTDGSFTVTLFLPATGTESFASLRTPADVDAFFVARFPDAHRLMPQLTETFFANPTGNMVTVHCAPWSTRNHIVLLGDAAHAIVPFHGQGMNCAFEDCLAVDRLLDAHNDWPALFAAFERERKPNTDAIAEMALENYIEMRDTVRQPKYLLQKQLSAELERRFPQRFIPRYSMVMFHHEIPYAEARARGAAQQKILDRLTATTERLEEIDWDLAASLLSA